MRVGVIGLTAAVMLIAVPRVAHGQRVDKALLLQLVDGQLSSMESLSCEYEISVVFEKRGSDDPRVQRLDGPVFTFYGRLDWLNNGDYHLRSSKVDNRTNSTYLIELSLIDKKSTSFVKEMNEPHGSAEIGRVGYQGYDWADTAFDFLPLFHLRNELQRAESEVVDEGSGEGSEAGSRILRLVYYKDQPPEKGRSLRLWIDFDEGVRVTKSELYEGRDLMCAFGYTSFKEYASGESRVWLPSLAEKKSFMKFDRDKGQIKYVSQPRIVASFNLIADKVRFKDPRIRKNISFAIPKGTMVTDAIKKLSYEEGRDLRRAPRTPKEYDHRLLEYVKSAADAEQEIRATSLARSSTTRFPWLSGLAMCVLAALLMLVAYKRAFSR